jgi:hypothetical protein
MQREMEPSPAFSVRSRGAWSGAREQLPTGCTRPVRRLGFREISFVFQNTV